LIPVEQALSTVLDHASFLAAESVPLEDALHRVLAADVASDVDMPPFARSAMDGFAVRDEDTRATPVTLPVVAQVKAGAPPGLRLPPGSAAEIMTGAPVPEGATAVQQVEKTRFERQSGAVAILESVVPGQNVAPRGSEVRAGDVVLKAGERLGPARLGVLAAVGRSSVPVGRRPKVALVVTGDEVVEAASRPGPGQIRNSNGPAVAAQLRDAGAILAKATTVGDDEEALAGAIDEGLRHDVLVLSGGVSKGVFDLVEGVLERAGVELLFTQVAIKPGAPLVFGRRGQTLVFGLPGNPVSAQVTFDLFVRPALLRQQGAADTARPRVEARLLRPVKNRSGRRAHHPAHLSFEPGGFVAAPLDSRGSADLVVHARANALVVLEADRTEAAAGETVPALLLASFLDA